MHSTESAYSSSWTCATIYIIWGCTYGVKFIVTHSHVDNHVVKYRWKILIMYMPQEQLLTHRLLSARSAYSSSWTCANIHIIWACSYADPGSREASVKTAWDPFGIVCESYAVLVKVTQFLLGWLSLAHDPIFGKRGRAFTNRKPIVYRPCMMFCVSLFYESMHMGSSQVCIFLYAILVLTLRFNMIFWFTKRNMCMCLRMVLPVHQ